MLKSMWSTEGDLKILPTMIFDFDLKKVDSSSLLL